MPDPTPGGPVACPICGRPAAPAPRLRPFCSVRCADVDLGRWFTGAYAIPVAPGEGWEHGADEDDPEAP